MGGCLSRIAVLENTSDESVRLRECFENDPRGTASRPVVVAPHSRKLISATKYHRHSIDSGIPRVIKLYRNGDVLFKMLTPQDFISSSKFIFRLQNDEMAVSRIRAAGQDLSYQGVRLLLRKHGEKAGRASLSKLWFSAVR